MLDMKPRSPTCGGKTMEDLATLWSEYGTFVLLALAAMVVLVLLRALLNRPSKEELEHERRMEKLKREQKDRYRDLRPLK